MDLFAIIAVAVISTALCLIVKQYHPEYAMLISVCCGIMIFVMVINSIIPALETINELMSKADINVSYIKAIVKTLGVCYVTELAHDSCVDAGQTAIAAKVELAGKAFIVILTLPLFKEIAEIAFSLIG